LKIEDIKPHTELKQRIEKWIQQKRAGVATDEDRKREEKKGAKEAGNAGKEKAKTKKENDYISYLNNGRAEERSGSNNIADNFESSLKLDD
jgi:regulator of protease activity HflC (stomatin/prohibitin superfamily)